MRDDTRIRLLYIRDALLDQATSFTCSEAAGIAAIYREDIGDLTFADQFLAAHALGDEEGDAHHVG